MASKRIAQSSINWAALAERTPANQKINFSAFKARSDKYLRSVLANPEQPPKIDWSFYKTHVGIPGLVETFQKSYEALKVPYPQDNLTPTVENRRKEIQQEIAQIKKESAERIAETQKELERIKNLLPYSQMTLEDYLDANPGTFDMVKKPTFWPHTPEEQLDWVDPKDAAAAAAAAKPH